MDNKAIANGSCLCGSVNLSFALKSETFDACHCGMCRKWGGGPLLTIEGGSQIAFNGQDNITKFESSKWAVRGFCNKCGTHLFYQLKDSGVCYIPLGLINNTEKFEFKVQIFVDRKPDHYSFANETEMMTEAQVFAKHSNG